MVRADGHGSPPQTLPPTAERTLRTILPCPDARCSASLRSLPASSHRRRLASTFTRLAADTRSRTRVNTASCVSTSINRRVRDSVEWSGDASVTSRSRNDRRSYGGVVDVAGGLGHNQETSIGGRRERLASWDRQQITCHAHCSRQSKRFRGVLGRLLSRHPELLVADAPGLSRDQPSC